MTLRFLWNCKVFPFYFYFATDWNKPDSICDCIIYKLVQCLVWRWAPEVVSEISPKSHLQMKRRKDAVLACAQTNYPSAFLLFYHCNVTREPTCKVNKKIYRNKYNSSNAISKMIRLRQSERTLLPVVLSKPFF